MKILLITHVFHPGVGGIETVSRILAEEFQKAGHEVRVVTRTQAETPDKFAYCIIRNPNRSELLAQHRWCDVCFHNNLCAGYAWPLLVFHRPWVIAHHMWLDSADGVAGESSWRGRWKKRLTQIAENLAVSRAIAEKLPGRAQVVGNPYDENVFFDDGKTAREKDLIFCGRLVSDKGVPLLVSALGILQKKNLFPHLTLVGEGPEKVTLQTQAETLGVEKQISFAGNKSPQEVAGELRAHRVQIVPSSWNEPFGLVALEGLACGCKLIVSKSGGLPEAAGKCARIFSPNDVESLALEIERALLEPTNIRDDAERRTHLARFKKATIAQLYLEAFQRAILKSAG